MDGTLITVAPTGAEVDKAGSLLTVDTVVNYVDAKLKA